MTVEAFQLEGVEGASRHPVRVELRLITDDGVAPLVLESFAAPRGFLSPEDAVTAGSCTSRTPGASGLEALRRSGFRAPQGFLGA